MQNNNIVSTTKNKKQICNFITKISLLQTIKRQPMEQFNKAEKGKFLDTGNESKQLRMFRKNMAVH